MPNGTNATPEYARHEFDVLQLLQKAGVPASQPLLLDADETYFGVPALVLSYVPGRSFFTVGRGSLGRRPGACPRRCPHRHAAALRPFTSLRRLSAVRENLDQEDRAPSRRPAGAPAYETLWQTLDVSPVEPCLVHDDYWPGNTVWYRGRLAAVIDWTDAGLGDPRVDVSQCRADLVFSNGLATADAFMRRYEAAAGGRCRMPGTSTCSWACAR